MIRDQNHFLSSHIHPSLEVLGDGGRNKNPRKRAEEGYTCGCTPCLLPKFSNLLSRCWDARSGQRGGQGTIPPCPGPPEAGSQRAIGAEPAVPAGHRGTGAVAVGGVAVGAAASVAFPRRSEEELRAPRFPDTCRAPSRQPRGAGRRRNAHTAAKRRRAVTL